MKKSKIPKFYVPITDMSSEEYHGLEGTYSSSQLKDLHPRTNMKEFYDKHIAKTEARERKSNFDFGTVCHSLLLEPDNLEKDCAVFSGKVRNGGAWELFEKKNRKKAIVTQREFDQAKAMVSNVRKNKWAKKYLKGGQSEVSIFIKLQVWNGKIYSRKFTQVMTMEGWMPYSHKGELPDNAIPIVVKVRADRLNEPSVVDLKTTSCNVKDQNEMKEIVTAYSYQFSGAFYLDMFTIGLRKSFKEFIWIFSDKKNHQCEVWKMSKTNHMIGRKRWMTAVLLLAEGIKNDWIFSEQDEVLRELEPQPWELKELEEDLTNYL